MTLITSPPSSSGEALHDSLQYHFFFPGLFVAARVFHTSSLQHHSAWICELGGEAGGDGAQAGVQAGVAPAALQLHSTEMPLISGGGAGVDLAGEEMAVRDEGPGGLTLHLSPSAEGPVEALRKAGCAEGVLKVGMPRARAISRSSPAHLPPIPSGDRFAAARLRVAAGRFRDRGRPAGVHPP